jgi:hypothetical protein
MIQTIYFCFYLLINDKNKLLKIEKKTIIRLGFYTLIKNSNICIVIVI